MNRKDFEIDALCDYSVKMIENEIVHIYKNSCYYDLGNDTLLNLRKNIINKELLAHQAEILPDIMSFNEALREALHNMYDRAHRVWDKMIDAIDEGDGEEMELTANCYLDFDYPASHPIQGDDRQDLWYALCDEELNPLYADGISVLTLTFPRDENYTFDTFIGMDSPPPNWNEGLDPELTKDLHLISQFHNLFQHMLFALTDFIYVRKFRTEINIEITK